MGLGVEVHLPAHRFELTLALTITLALALTLTPTQRHRLELTLALALPLTLPSVTASNLRGCDFHEAASVPSLPPPVSSMPCRQ